MVFESNRDPGDENDKVVTTFIPDALPIGKALRITTRNSTYEIRKQAGGKTWRVEQTKASPDPDAYVLKPNPVVAVISNPTLKVGSSLFLWRESPVATAAARLTRTSTIQSIEEIK